MLKLVGAVIICLTSLALGVHASITLHHRVRKLSGLIAALARLSGEIAYRMTPLPEALKVAARDAPNELEAFWHKLFTLIGRNGAASCGASLVQAASLLDSPERDIVCDLSTVLGRFAADRQCAAIDMALVRLEREHNDARQAHAQKGRVYITISSCCGLAAAIILM